MRDQAVPAPAHLGEKKPGKQPSSCCCRLPDLSLQDPPPSPPPSGHPPPSPHPRTIPRHQALPRRRTQGSVGAPCHLCHSCLPTRSTSITPVGTAVWPQMTGMIGFSQETSGGGERDLPEQGAQPGVHPYLLLSLPPPLPGAAPSPAAAAPAPAGGVSGAPPSLAGGTTPSRPGCARRPPAVPGKGGVRDQEGRRKGSRQDRHQAGLTSAFANLTKVQGRFERSETTRNPRGSFPSETKVALLSSNTTIPQGHTSCNPLVLCRGRNVPLGLLKTEGARQEHSSWAESWD